MLYVLYHQKARSTLKMLFQIGIDDLVVFSTGIFGEAIAPVASPPAPVLGATVGFFPVKPGW